MNSKLITRSVIQTLSLSSLHSLLVSRNESFAGVTYWVHTLSDNHKIMFAVIKDGKKLSS